MEAVATYEGGVALFFCWIGQEMTGPMLRWRYANRFERVRKERLVTVSSGEIMEGERKLWNDPPVRDLDFDPHPSGYVIAGPDERAIQHAREILPRRNFLRENAFLFATADGMRLYHGRAEPMPDDVYDRFEDIDPGFPENLCR